MRLRLICLALLIVAGCSPTEVANVPTLRGPIVPTRVLPTATMTSLPTETPSPTATFTATETPTLTFTPSPTFTATNTATLLPTETVQPTATPTETPTNTATTAPTATLEPTSTPSPTDAPTLTPAFTPVVYSNATWIEPVEIIGEVPLDTLTHGSIDDEHPTALYTFSGTAGMVIDVEMTAPNDDLDTFLLLLDPKGREIARNDDLAADNGNSAIRGVILPETGAYVIVASRYGQEFGITNGTFGLLVTNSAGERFGTFSRNIGYDALFQDSLDDVNIEHVYSFRATAGDVITIQMTTTSGDLDPNLTLTDNLGTPLMRNDDNLLLGSLDSSIPGYIIPRTGYYSIVASRYLAEDNGGSYRLKLALDNQNAITRFAVLDPVNSASLGEEGDLYAYYSLGDEFDEAGEERNYQVLLTFLLPPANERGVEEAVLTFAPCFERGGGFAELGNMTIYSENYGIITVTRNIDRPQPGARILSTQSTCAPLNLTDLVQEAYSNGEQEIQFRLVFRDRTDNGEVDQVIISPTLLVTFNN